MSLLIIQQDKESDDGMEQHPRSTPHPHTKTVIPAPWQSIGALYLPLAAFLALVAIGTGSVGLFVKNRRKGFALTGLILGGCSILLFTGIVVMVFAFAAQNSPSIRITFQPITS